MTKEEILIALQKEVEGYNKIIATDRGDWIVKGFIDIYKNIYTITIDTKVVSKVMEILLIPAFHNFAEKNDLILELPPEQNFYPDLTFISRKTGEKYAVDIKSTFKDTTNKIKSMFKLLHNFKLETLNFKLICYHAGNFLFHSGSICLRISASSSLLR